MFLIKPNTFKYCLIAISQLSVKTLRKQLRRWKEFNVVWKIYMKWICWVKYFYVNWSGRGKQTSFVRYSRTNFILCRNIHFMIHCIWFWWSMYWLTSVTNTSFLICRELHCWGCGWFLLASVSSLGGIVLFMCGVYFPSSLHSSLLKHPENLSQALHQGKWFTHR